jgi:hypothetical protein
MGDVYVAFASSPRGLDFDSSSLVQAIEEGFQVCAKQDLEAAPSPVAADNSDRSRPPRGLRTSRSDAG